MSETHCRRNTTKFNPTKKNTPNYFMSKAVKEALKGTKNRDGGPFGCVIVKNNVIISLGHNTVLSSKIPVNHAEINAIKKASKKLDSFDLSGCELYSTTEPCPMCFSAIHWARIKTIYFGTTINDVKKLGFNELSIPARIMKKIGSSPVKIISEFSIKECRALLKKWKELPGKKIY
ncbi:CMP/dCMP deaminase, zinc-binding [Candidatus Omnitrophus magneticus]|uniref:CMP/dCMP deaminase, zinc-binding n=1 Tax=Candidatus Omnitrophus magneticus TaxID=1609969 RepID=A0A0F0CMR4_9BACT|nr:CMP/dCMP deaminase, zinc-binding [Candidatus Omnitrophus magneticus]